MELEKAEMERSTYVTEVREVLTTELLNLASVVMLSLYQNVTSVQYKVSVAELPSSYKTWTNSRRSILNSKLHCS